LNPDVSAAAAGATGPSPLPSRPWWHVLLPGLVVIAGLLAYSNAGSGTFVFDDDQWVVGNRESKQRALVTWTLNRNRAVAKRDPVRNEPEARGYLHFNVAVHLAAGLALYGVVRRTLLTPRLRERFGAIASWFALAVALLWVVHPLQTQSVMYVIQRAQSMAGLCYLLVFYAALRMAEAQAKSAAPQAGRGLQSFDSIVPIAWLLVALIASCMGMVSKADMVTAPVLLLLFDGVFLAGSWREVLRRRWMLYAGLALSWLMLVQAGVTTSVLSTSKPSATVGFSYGGATPFEYLLTQAEVIPHYLKLVFWPSRLCLDYGWAFVRSASEVYLQGMLILAALAAGSFGVIRRNPLGFAVAAFFVLLAPTSSIVPIRDAAFEHRMYLALAPVLILIVGLICAAMPWLLARREARIGSLVLAGLLAVALGMRTHQRNEDYADDIRLWRTVTAAAPDNARAHYNLGKELGDRADRLRRQQLAAEAAARQQEAIESYKAALALNPDHVMANNNLGMEYGKRGEAAEAIPYFERAVAADRKHVLSRSNLALALSNTGRHDEALPLIEEAVRLDARNAEKSGRPRNAEIWNNYGLVLMRLRRFDEAIEKFEATLRLAPGHQAARTNIDQIRRFTGAQGGS
jgi:Tfp pilus assembly protein PilF